MTKLQDELNLRGGLVCQACDGEKSEVIDSRPSNKLGGSIRRRRRCATCGALFTTYEMQGISGQIEATKAAALDELSPALDAICIGIRRLYGKE